MWKSFSSSTLRCQMPGTGTGRRRKSRSSTGCTPTPQQPRSAAGSRGRHAPAAAMSRASPLPSPHPHPCAQQLRWSPAAWGQGGPGARVRWGNPRLSGHTRRKHRWPPAPRPALPLWPAPHLDSLDRILYLEQPALGAAQQVAGSVRGCPLKSSPPAGGPDRVQAAEGPAQVLT